MSYSLSFLVRLFILLELLIVVHSQGRVLAGVASFDITPEVGVPLAGYSNRKVDSWPIPQFTKYTAFLKPSVGVETHVMAKCLALKSETEGKTTIFVSMDAIGSSGSLTRHAYQLASKKGLKTPLEHVITGASHSHGSFGAVAHELIWALAPATDIYQPAVAEFVANKLADCMVSAENNLQPALVGVGSVEFKGVSRNRRSGISRHVNSSSVDPTLSLIKVDALDGKPLATLWNFPFHGTCYGGSMMKINGDLSGVTNQVLEASGQTGIALFMNGAAGDIAPTGEMCQGAPRFRGAQVYSEAVINARKNIRVYQNINLNVASHIVNFGNTKMNLTLERVMNCTDGGFMDICAFCRRNPLCVIDVGLDDTFVENTPRFTGVRIGVGGKNYGFATFPGEGIQALAHQLKSESKSLGYDETFVLGYANNHMGYFTTPEEYVVGGYESLLSFWGITTGIQIRRGALRALELVRP